MAGITLAQAEAKLTLYLSLDDQLGVNSEVTINGVTYRRHQLKEIRESITYWNRMVNQLSRASSGLRVREVVPR